MQLQGMTCDPDPARGCEDRVFAGLLGCDGHR